MCDRIGIDGREYKLLLDPAPFARKPYAKAARTFWSRDLKPIIKKALDAKDGSSRAEGALRLEKERIVLFLDTKEGHLARRGVALRIRTRFKDGELEEVPEITLKFRTPDVMLAAAYRDAAKRFGGATVLEDDIAPMQVGRSRKPAATAKPHTTYSRFSVSTKHTDIKRAFNELGDVFQVFGALPDLLDAGRKAADEELRAGPTVYEWVFQKARVDLGKGFDDAEFGFTLWHFAKAGTRRLPFGNDGDVALKLRVAEISFDFKTPAGSMDADAARRARKLFIAMQEKLRVNRFETSKTALALPPRRK
jgi:hypothetical protein